MGYEYLTASSKEEYLKVLDRFVTPEKTEKPIILEVFTDSKEESDMLKKVYHLLIDSKLVAKRKVLNLTKNVLGKKGNEIIKKIIP